MNDLAKIPRLRVENQGGAPKGNRNALKAGMDTAGMRAWWARVRDQRQRVRIVLAQRDAKLATPRN
ncbi:MAG: hypothetical protein KGL56_07790 [Alphaproteobacteria bacterium]|nr:hypothetical protein [Alphaproteobacteria bacterium]